MVIQMERKIYFTTACAAKQQRRVGAEKESKLLRSLRKQQSEARYHSNNFPFLIHRRCAYLRRDLYISFYSLFLFLFCYDFSSPSFRIFDVYFTKKKEAKNCREMNSNSLAQNSSNLLLIAFSLSWLIRAHRPRKSSCSLRNDSNSSARSIAHNHDDGGEEWGKAGRQRWKKERNSWRQWPIMTTEKNNILEDIIELLKSNSKS